MSAANESAKGATSIIEKPAFMQNRELSWLTFDQRVLDQALDENVPLLERLNFISIFWSNLQEFFMVRVGSLTDLSLVKSTIIDSKSGMTPGQQLDAIYARCHELYPLQESAFKLVSEKLREQNVNYVSASNLNDDQRSFLETYMQANVFPMLAPQIVNSRHPFPHLGNGSIYVVVRVDESATLGKEEGGKKKKKGGAQGVTLGFIPLPRQCRRVIALPCEEGFAYTLLEEAIELFAHEVFDMYKVKRTNIICVTRNADLDTNEGADEADDDYREYMKRILKTRGRLAPVRLECARPLSENERKWLLSRLNLKDHQVFETSVPLDLSYTWGLGSHLPDEKSALLREAPFDPTWPSAFDQQKSIIKQVCKHEVLLNYPYESMDPFIKMLREAAVDPDVISINITLYRLASTSRLAEAIIEAAENGKRVTALFELRARFDENNNIEWSQRFEDAGCNVIYGFRDYKVHSKICSITRQTEDGIQYITQLGTGNYNEKTARLYTDFSFFTTDPDIGRDAAEFFRNMTLENAADDYKSLWVAPLQIKPNILACIDDEIAKARAGKPCGLLFKTNSITDGVIIKKIAEASQAGVPTTLFVRGISCIVPGVEGYTENVKVVSIVGRLLEHSRVYAFGAPHSDDFKMYLSSADLMTRNMDKRVEIAWPIKDEALRQRALEYLETSLRDTAKLRVLQPDGTYTLPEALTNPEVESFDSQAYHINLSRQKAEEAVAIYAARRAAKAKAKAERKARAESERLAEILKQAEEARQAEAAAIAEEQALNEQLEQALEATPSIAAEIASEPVAKVEAKPAATPEPEPAVEVKAEPVVEAKPVADAKPEPAAEPKHAAKPEVDSAFRPAPKPKTEPKKAAPQPRSAERKPVPAPRRAPKKGGLLGFINKLLRR